MTTRSKTLVAQQRLFMSFSEDKDMYIRVIVCSHWACSNISKRILEIAYIFFVFESFVLRRRRRLKKRLQFERIISEKKQACDSVCCRRSNNTKKQALEINSSRRNLRSRFDSRNQTTTFSVQKTTTRKRSRIIEVEQVVDFRRFKRSRNLVEQFLSVQQFKKRKRRLNISESDAIDASHKRARRTFDKAAVDNSAEQEKLDNVDDQKYLILYWTKTRHWFKEYSQQSDKNMNHLLVRQKSSSFLRRKQSTQMSVNPASVATDSVASSSTTFSDQKSREVKSAFYQDARYEILLVTKRSFMNKSVLAITQTSKTNYLHLFDAKQIILKDSLFCDNLFEETCEMIRNKNEARVIRDVSQLIVFLTKVLTARDAESLRILVESVNEDWNNFLLLTETRSQSNFSVKFKRKTFINEQLDKFTSFIDNFIFDDQSYFMITYYMYFSFLTCEMKCDATTFDVADRQNAHSMTLAMRAIVELFKLVDREQKLHREILVFSMLHDHRSMRIYEHYSVIDEKNIKFYRHSIHEFNFTALNEKKKWTTYKFIKNVYEVWMSSHFKRLCSTVNQISIDLDFSVSQLSQSFELSEDLERHNLSRSSQPDSQSQENSQQSIDDNARDFTFNISFIDRDASKRSRKRLAEEQ